MLQDEVKALDETEMIVFHLFSGTQHPIVGLEGVGVGGVFAKVAHALVAGLHLDVLPTDFADEGVKTVEGGTVVGFGQGFGLGRGGDGPSGEAVFDVGGGNVGSTRGVVGR